MSSILGSGPARPGRKRWPSRPRAADRHAFSAMPLRLLSSAQWTRLGSALADRGRGTRVSPSESARTRAIAEGVLWILRSGAPWSSLPKRLPSGAICRSHWRAWMRDGRWIDFWSAYVATLGPRGWLEWSRALARSMRTTNARPSRGDTARHAWWLVSTGVLWGNGASTEA